MILPKDHNGKELHLFDIVYISDSDDWDFDGIIIEYKDDKLKVYCEKISLDLRDNYWLNSKDVLFKFRNESEDFI